MLRLSSRHLSFAVLALALAACGGGGGGGSDSGSGGGGSAPDATPVAPGGSVNYASAPTLSGVAAAGAPLTQASISVVDGKGVAVGSATSHAVDGSYSVTLNTRSLTVPLMVQARGMDAAGTPQVLHSAVPAMSAASAAMVANVTPLTNAIVALSLGADPAPVFGAGERQRNGADPARQCRRRRRDLPEDAGQDAVDGPQVHQRRDAGPAGRRQLQRQQERAGPAGRKRAGLAGQQRHRRGPAPHGQQAAADADAGGRGRPAAGADRTAEKHRRHARHGHHLDAEGHHQPDGDAGQPGSLDELGAALNKLIAQAPDLPALADAPLLSVYDVNDGRNKADAAIKLQSYVAKNWQFGRFQVTGCADAAVSGGLCNRVMVAAPVSDSSGTVVDVYADAVSFNKNSTTGSRWNLIGNGRDIAINAYPLAFLALNADASLSAAISPNPGVGIQIEIQAQSRDTPPVQLLTTATVQTPGGFSIPFAYCTMGLMCISSTPGATLLTPTGGIGDTALQQAAVGWIGSADSVAGARYIASYKLNGSTTVQTRNLYLRADVKAGLAAARFPALDGLTAAAPLRSGEILVGRTLNWAAWAAANPDMRLISIRTVLSDGDGAPRVTDTAPPLPPLTTLALAGLALDPGFVPTSYEVWLGAQDGAGRRYYTRYSLAP